MALCVAYVVVKHKLKDKHAHTVETPECPALYHVIRPGMAQDLDALAAVPLFAPLDHDRLGRPAAHSTVRTVDAGSVVATRGQPSTHLIVIEAGALTAAHAGLAEAIGMIRVSVNRALRTLAHEGLIRVEPGTVVVLAPELLALRASQDQQRTS